MLRQEITKHDVAKVLIDRGESRIDATGYMAIPTLLPDWGFNSHFTLERGTTLGVATVWANREIVIPRLDDPTDENWSVVRNGLLRHSGDISSQIRNFFGVEHDDIDTEAINVPSLSDVERDFHRLQIELTTLNATERPQITTAFLGGLIMTDLLLARFGMEVSPTVSFDAVSYLIREPSVA